MDRVTNGQIGGLIGCAAMIAAGQVLFKWAALAVAKSTQGPSTMVYVLRMPSFWAALVVYGSATLFWTYILRSVPLSRAYPFIALGFVIVPICAVLVFDEKLNMSYYLGTGLIVLGILLAVRS